MEHHNRTLEEYYVHGVPKKTGITQKSIQEKLLYLVVVGVGIATFLAYVYLCPVSMSMSVSMSPKNVNLLFIGGC
jgi:hypothetical protein